jgi:WhiB family redox-sensing transcriptional regulator
MRTRQIPCVDCGTIRTITYAGADSNTVKGICGRCTVNTTCLDWAIDTDQLHGIWGGMTRTERTREAARRRAAA